MNPGLIVPVSLAGGRDSIWNYRGKRVPLQTEGPIYFDAATPEGLQVSVSEGVWMPATPAGMVMSPIPRPSFVRVRLIESLFSNALGVVSINHDPAEFHLADGEPNLTYQEALARYVFHISDQPLVSHVGEGFAVGAAWTNVADGQGIMLGSVFTPEALRRAPFLEVSSNAVGYVDDGAGTVWGNSLLQLNLSPYGGDGRGGAGQILSIQHATQDSNIPSTLRVRATFRGPFAVFQRLFADVTGIVGADFSVRLVGAPQPDFAQLIIAQDEAKSANTGLSRLQIGFPGGGHSYKGHFVVHAPTSFTAGQIQVGGGYWGASAGSAIPIPTAVYQEALGAPGTIDTVAQIPPDGQGRARVAYYENGFTGTVEMATITVTPDRG